MISGRFWSGILEISFSYEFWGYCDIDMMFGDLARLLSDEFWIRPMRSVAYDEQFVGHFTILRNTEVMNRAGFKIDDWQRLCVPVLQNTLTKNGFPE